jgi:hypothetical protein
VTENKVIDYKADDEEEKDIPVFKPKVVLTEI